MSHNYHPHCGCSACCQQEEADERDDELLATYLPALTCCPDFIGEVALNAEECTAIAAAINAGDTMEAGRVFQAAVEREASEAIERRAEDSGATLGEAAERLFNLYKPAAAFDAARFANGMAAGNEADIAGALGVAA